MFSLRNFIIRNCLLLLSFLFLGTLCLMMTNDDYTKHLIYWAVLITVVFMTCHAEPSAI